MACLLLGNIARPNLPQQNFFAIPVSWEQGGLDE